MANEIQCCQMSLSENDKINSIGSIEVCINKPWKKVNLPITITNNLDWGHHISEITTNATRALEFLRQNLAFAPRQTKDAAYKYLVRPKLGYAAPSWHPHVKTQITQLEKVQRTAARWACRRWRNTSSVGDMLDDLDWPALEARREKSSLAFFHKIHIGIVSIGTLDMYPLG